MKRHVIAALALFVVASPAWALKCYQQALGTSVDGAKAVPLNARILVETTMIGSEQLELKLVGPDGKRIPLEVVHEGNAHVVVRPTGPLKPDAEHRLTSKGEKPLDVSFQTSASTDDEAPATPSVKLAELDLQQENKFHQVDRLHLEVEGEADLFEVQLSKSDTFAEAWSVFSVDGSISVGSTPCRNTLREWDREATLYGRVRAVDHAGNASEWVKLAW